MRDLLLIFAAPKRNGDYINKLPPAGILYLAAYLTKKGFSVDIIDCSLEKISRDKFADYRVIGFSINIANLENSLSLINEISGSEPQVTLIAGGPLPTVSPGTFFTAGLKAIFISEAEESLYKYLLDPGSRSNKGYYFRDNTGNWVFNGLHPFVRDLDELPFPALDKIELAKYYTPVKKAVPVSILISSRGCPFSCAFCCKVLGSQYRERSAINVVAEIEWQVTTLGVKEIAIYDDNFTLDNQRVEAICALLDEKRIKISLQLTNGVRADTLSLDLLRKMRKAGFWMIALAPESGNPQTLRRINKGFDLERIKQCLSWCRTAGLRTWLFFMLGFPWEDAEMFERTVQCAVRLDADFAHFSNFVPLPGTALYEQVNGKAAVWQLKDAGFFAARRQGPAGQLRRHSDGLTARAYRKVYLNNPRKILGLFRVFSVYDLFKIVWYAFKSGNIR